MELGGWGVYRISSNSEPGGDPSSRHTGLDAWDEYERDIEKEANEEPVDQLCVSVVGGLPAEHLRSPSAVAMAEPRVVPLGACSVQLLRGEGESETCLPGKRMSIIE